MIDIPMTLAEAQAYKYNKWAGNPSGREYNPARCAYERWSGGRGSLPYQCQHGNGYGPDNLYCKQHAKQLGLLNPESPKHTIFIADFSNRYGGTPYLAKVIISSETPKTFSVESSENLLHSTYLGKRINKKGIHWFDSKEDALDWLIEQATEYVYSCEINLSRAKVQVEELTEVRKSLAEAVK